MNKNKSRISAYGKWAIVTGASSGIGKEFAYRLASYGMDLIITARREELLLEIKDDLESRYNVEVIIVAGDLSNSNVINSLKALIESKDIGLLVNNAGFGHIGHFEDADEQAYINMIAVNCTASTLLTTYVINRMKKKGKGAIIFLGSTFAFIPTPFASLYSATKAFNNVLGICLYEELKQNNIDVLSLNPGGTKTEFKRISNDNLLTRLPKDVVNTAIKSLGKKAFVIDGFVNRILIFIAKFVPKNIMLSLAASAANKKSK